MSLAHSLCDMFHYFYTVALAELMRLTTSVAIAYVYVHLSLVYYSLKTNILQPIFKCRENRQFAIQTLHHLSITIYLFSACVCVRVSVSVSF